MTARRRTVPRRVHTVGSYGFKNFGDDLFVDTLRENSSHLWPGASVRTLVPSASKLYATESKVGALVRLGTAAAGIAWADAIAYCGGSILQDVRGVERIRQVLIGGRRLQALGVSVGPFPSNDAAVRVRDLLARAERLVLRDNASLRRMEGLGLSTDGVAVGGDLVALSGLIQARKAKNYITICPSAAAHSRIDELAEQARDAVAAFERTTRDRPSVLVLALCQQSNSNDMELCRPLADSLASNGLSVRVESYTHIGLARTCKLIAESRMVWSQRLHGGIVAYLSDVPFLLVGHHAKCVDFMSDIGADTYTVNSVREPWAPIVEDLVLRPAFGLMEGKQYRARARQAYTLRQPISNDRLKGC